MRNNVNTFNRIALSALLGGVSIIALQLGASTPASAQARERAEAAAPVSALSFDEIVVTATRRAERLLNVPLSVTAYSQEALDRKGTRNIDDIVRLTPGIQLDRLARYNGTSSNITVRGVRSTSGLPTTGVYVDDTPIQLRSDVSQSGAFPYPRLFDLERIEVLRGPQGTLFGSGAMGGAVRFITPSPTMSGFDLYGRAEIATTDDGGASYEAGAAVGTPIVEDKVGLRMSAYYRKDGGFVDRVDYGGNIVDKNANHADAVALRGALAFKVSDALVITPSLIYQKTKIGDTSAYVEAISNPAQHDFKQNNPVQQAGSEEFILPAVNIQFEFGSAVLISNTSYLDNKVINDYDATTLDLAQLGGVLGPPPAALQHVFALSAANRRTKMFTQEARLQNNDPDSRLNWVIGGYYQHAKNHDEFSVENPFLLEVINYGRANMTPPLPPLGAVAERFFGVGLYQGRYALLIDSSLKDEQISGFAQVDYNLTEELKVTLGARYGDLSFTSNSFAAGPVIVSNGRITIIDQGSKPFTPKVGLSWQADDDNLFYGNVAKGFRVGSVAPAVGNRCASDAVAMGFDPNVPREVQPDSLWSYEVGSKNRFLDGALVLDAAAYYIDWKRTQTSLTLPSCGIPTTINASDVVSKGFDLTVTATPLSGLNLAAMASYNDSHYSTETASSIPGAPVYAVSEPLGVAPWSLYLSGEYEFDLESLRPYVRGEVDSHLKCNG